MIVRYLAVGLIFYIVMLILRHKGLKSADLASLLRGFLFGVFLWPIAVLFTIFGDKK